MGLFQQKQAPSPCARAPGDLRVAQRALRWHLRRRTEEDADLAQHWLAELAYSSNGLYAWRELVLAAAELAGPANACWTGRVLARLTAWNAAAAARGGGPRDPDYDMRQAGPELTGPLAATAAELHALPKDERADTVARLVAYGTPGGLDAAEAAAPAPPFEGLDWEDVWLRAPEPVRAALRYFAAALHGGDVGGAAHAAMLVSVWGYPDQAWLTLQTYLAHAGADETTRFLARDLEYMASLYAPTAADRPEPPAVAYWGRVRIFLATAVFLAGAGGALREPPPPSAEAGRFSFFEQPAWQPHPAYQPAADGWAGAATRLGPADPPAEPDPARPRLRVLYVLGYGRARGVSPTLRHRAPALLHGRYAPPPPPPAAAAADTSRPARPVDRIPGFRPGAARALPDRAYVGAAPEWLAVEAGAPVVLAGPVGPRVVRRLEVAQAVAARLGCRAILPGRWLRTADGAWRVLRPPWPPTAAPPAAPVLAAGAGAAETLRAWALRWILGLPARRAGVRRAGGLVLTDLLGGADEGAGPGVEEAAAWVAAHAAELAAVPIPPPLETERLDAIYAGAGARWARLAAGDLNGRALLLLGDL